MQVEGQSIKAYNNPKYTFLKVVLILIFIQIGFGSYAVIVRKFSSVDPLIFSLLRDAACFPILLAAAIFLEGKHVPQLKHITLFFALGLTGMFGNQVLFIYGLYFTSSTIASIFQPLIPVITCAFALISGLEKFSYKDIYSWLKVWAIFTSGGGAIIMVTAKGTSFKGGNNSYLGYILLFGNTSAMAIYVLLQKKYLFYKDNFGKDVALYPPTTACAWSYGMGALIMGLCAIPYGIVQPSVFTFNLTFIYPLLYAIFISSALCYGLINYATSLTSATVVTAFWPLQVPTSAIESIFVFGEIPVWEEYIGALFIIMGLIAICWVKYREEIKQKVTVINDDH